MKKTNLTLNSSYIIFFIIAIFYAVGNFIWWKLNTPIIPYGISAVHLFGAFLDSFLYLYYAPLVTWIMKAMFFIFGKEYFDLQIIFVNYVFFLLSLFFIYKIGYKLKDKFTGNISMILFSLTPSIYMMSRYYGHQDWHIVSTIIINIYCLINTNYFTNRKWSFIYGISIGFGALVKDTFLPYFIVTFLFSVIYTFFIKLELKKVFNIIISMIVGLIICGCHYLRYPIILKILTDSNAQQVPLTFETTRCLTVGLWEELLSPPIFILLVIGAIWFILKYKNKYNKFLLLLWFFIPYLAILLMKHFKSVEYCLGFVPALILIVSIFLSDINKKIKKKVVISIVIILLIQYVDFSYTKNINMFYEPIRIFKHDIYYYRIKATDFKKEYVVVNKDIIDFLKNFYPDCTVGVPDIFVVGTDISIKVPLILYDIDYCDIEIFKNIATLDVETISENIIQKDIIIFFNNPLEEKEKKELVKIYTYFSMCSNAWQEGTFFYKYSEDAINKLNIILKTIEENYYILYKSGHTVVFKKR